MTGLVRAFALVLTGCGLAVYDPPATTPTGDSGAVPEGWFVIEARWGDGDWAPLDGAALPTDGSEVRLGAVDPKHLTEVDEVVWLLDDHVTRDRSGPPWSPHEADDAWPPPMGEWELCAHVWVKDSLEDLCVAFEVR